ncbi:acyl-CoA thioesterase [Crocinitomicaceae bacterium]|jgi:acyl-CoA thioester hydrolase|nr:acyl-CoA thioesterase [Crocinitomicaceae bacterium]MDG1347833.1 thioesterase family protein [Crocinitomicaceae bacterium]MDG2464590.1 thioesterase family protein [Crocinitomicaceae bacterium]
MTAPSPFEIQVRFSDIDVMQHVNNSIYLSYFEMTRVHYFSKLLSHDWDYNKDGFLLARNEVDYILPVLLTDKPKIIMKTEKIGNKSFTLSYEIQVDGVIYTKGISVMVCFDSAQNSSIPIPAKMREALQALVAE